MSLLAALLVTLVVLRAFEVIMWPWLLVFLPLWGPVAIVAIGLVIGFFASIIDQWRRQRYRNRARRRFVDRYKDRPWYKRWRDK